MHEEVSERLDIHRIIDRWHIGELSIAHIPYIQAYRHIRAYPVALPPDHS